MIYKTCRELPIHNFNEISLTSDLTYLVKDGTKYSIEQLQDAWLDILSEFILINPNQLLKYEESLKQDLFLMISKIKVLENIINNNLYTSTILNKLNIKKERVKKEYNKLRHKIAVLTSKLKGEEKAKKELNSFEKTLAVMTKFYGAKMDRKTTTVSEWLELKQAMTKDG